MNEVGAAPSPLPIIVRNQINKNIVEDNSLILELMFQKLRKQKVVTIACGALHSAALLCDGTIVTWGCNDDYCLGRVTGTNTGITERNPGKHNKMEFTSNGVTVLCFFIVGFRTCY